MSDRQWPAEYQEDALEAVLHTTVLADIHIVVLCIKKLTVANCVARHAGAVVVILDGHWPAEDQKHTLAEALQNLV